MRVTTWNIGGGHTVQSTKTFDYNEAETLDYFANLLRPLQLDVISLQESHTNEHDIVAKRLADLLDMPYVFDSPASPSHIDDSYQLSNAIISKKPIENPISIKLPPPSFELYFKDGSKARLFHRYLQITSIDGVCFANTHLQPLHHFGYTYEDGEGKRLAEQTQAVFREYLKQPLILAADLNDKHAEKTYQTMFDTLQLKDALGTVPTDNAGKKVDYIIYSPEFTLTDSGVIPTDADHHLCWAEFSLKGVPNTS